MSKSTNSIKYLIIISLLIIKNLIFTLLIVNLKYYLIIITRQILHGVTVELNYPLILSVGVLIVRLSRNFF